jgi:hypothetical protein
MTTSLYIIVVVFLFSREILIAQKTPEVLGERIAKVDGRFMGPQPLAEGYIVRLDKVESKSVPGLIESFNLVTHYPDGSEEIIWTLPATEPDPTANMEGASIPLKDLRILTAYASPEMTAVMLWKNANDYWWVRWDAQKKQLLPLIMRFSRGDSDRYYFLDANTVKVMTRGNVRLFTLKADRDGTLTKNGRPWDKNYTVYDGQREIGHAAVEYGGQVEVRKIGVAWPFFAKSQRPPATGNPLEPPRDSPPSLPVPAPAPNANPAASPPPAVPVAQLPAVTAGRTVPVWPWFVGIAALTVIEWLVWKRRA